MLIAMGDRIDWGSPAFPRAGTMKEMVGAVVVIAWDDGRTTRIPANVLERMARKP